MIVAFKSGQEWPCSHALHNMIAWICRDGLGVKNHGMNLKKFILMACCKILYILLYLFLLLKFYLCFQGFYQFSI